MDNQQGPAVQQKDLCSMLCASLDGSGEWIHAYVWPSPFAVHLKLSTLLITHTPTQNKKLKRKPSQSPFSWSLHPAKCLLNMSLKKGRNQNFKAQSTQPHNRSGSDPLGEMMVSSIWASGATTSACKQERYRAEERF